MNDRLVLIDVKGILEKERFPKDKVIYWKL